jgi:hypothetical protein
MGGNKQEGRTTNKVLEKETSSVQKIMLARNIMNREQLLELLHVNFLF